MLTKSEPPDVNNRVSAKPTAAATQVIDITEEAAASRLRRTAIVVGALFIAGDIAGVLSAALTYDLFKGPGSLTRINAHPNHLAIGTLCVLAMGFFLATVAFVMYPIFRKANEALAIGYVISEGRLRPLPTWCKQLTGYCCGI